MDWSNILVPALVAATVTLLIEYAAKPALDARKERILAKARARRDLIALLRRAHGSLIALMTFEQDPEASITAPHQKAWLLERKRLRAALSDQSLEIYDLAADFAEGKDGLVYEFLTAVAGALRGHAVYDPDQRLAPSEDGRLLVLFSIDLLEAPRRMPQGRRLRRDAEQWFRASQPGGRSDETEPTPSGERDPQPEVP